MELCTNVLQQFAHNLPDRRFSLTADPQPLIVQADSLRLEQVLTNLLDNAVKYSPNGGPVVIAVTVRGDNACIAVTDQGLGIPSAEVGRIFEAYYQAHAGNYRSGLGLGLYISNEIARLHGGEITAESVEGVGTTVTICLPLPSGQP